jgi:hypothetical protein
LVILSDEYDSARLTSSERQSQYEYILTAPLPAAARPADIIGYAVWFDYRFNLRRVVTAIEILKINGRQHYLWRAVDEESLSQSLPRFIGYIVNLSKPF